MTTIGTSVGMMSSPRAMMDKRIDAAVEAGSISATDETALETALDAIDSSLSASGSSGSTRLDPSEMKERIDSLIADQVENGTLTEDQAATLQSFFAQGGPPPVGGDAGGEGEMSIDGVGSADAMRGPPPPPPPSGSSDDSDDDSTSTSLTSTDQLDAIIAFLENLRSSIASQTYGANSSASDSSNAGLLVDSLA